MTASLHYQQRSSIKHINISTLTSENIELPILTLNPQLTTVALPLFIYKVPAGFPSPADDHLEATIDVVIQTPLSFNPYR